jgi:hypothetical protein
VGSTNGIYEIVKRGVKRWAKGDLPLITQTPRGEACILATRRRGARVRTYVEINESLLEKTIGLSPDKQWNHEQTTNQGSTF